ncbi:MAG: GAF domain-containing sensor histidine kinase [Chloroflexi bacterium]|nr:GAF domain-containing sensor histidine kinase [Chloroflexota bacterium]
MGEKSDQWRRTFLLLRWLVPVTMGGLGAGYVLWEHAVVGPGGLSAQAIREAVFLGTVGPLLAWLTLSWAVAAAEARARAKEELEQRNQELLFLNAIGETVSRSLELQEVLTSALDRILAFTELEAGTIWVLEGQQLSLKCQRGVSPQFVSDEAALELGECLCGTAARRGQVCTLLNLSSAAGMARPGCSAEGFRSVMAVPARAKQKTVGVIHLASREARAFGPEEERMLAAVGNEVGLAIENARLYHEVRNFNQLLERRVDERTEQLSRATQEVSHKAQQLHELLARTTRIQEDERARIANDMHDGVIQLIVGAGYEVQAARECLAARPEVSERKLRTAQALLDRIEVETRRAIYNLRPLILDTAGLVSALKELCREHQTLTRVACTVSVSGEPVRLPAEAEAAVYRIVQEALHNVQVHGMARTVGLSLTFEPRRLRLEIRDDGRGFSLQRSPTNTDHGLGLIGMQERAQSLGGSLAVETAPGAGTRIILQVPLARDCQDDDSPLVGD